MADVQNIARPGVHFAYLYAQKFLTFSFSYQVFKQPENACTCFIVIARATNIELTSIPEISEN